MFGLSFYEWMAFIGGYPTIFSTFFLMGMVIYTGTRAIYRHKDLSSIKFHIKETLYYEEEIQKLLKKSKPLTKWRFKKLVGKHTYMEFMFEENTTKKRGKSLHKTKK
jgi:hypothetical protein